MRELLSRRCLLNWDLKKGLIFGTCFWNSSCHNKLPRHCGNLTSEICQALVCRYQKWNLDVWHDMHFVLVWLMTAVHWFCCYDLTVTFLLEVCAAVQCSPGMSCSSKFGICWHCSDVRPVFTVLCWRILFLITFVLCLIWIEKNQILCCFSDFIQKLPHRVTGHRKCFSIKVSVSAKALVHSLLCMVLPVVSLAYFDWCECEMSF